MSRLALGKRLQGLEVRQAAVRHSRCETCRDLRECQVWPRLVVPKSEEEYALVQEMPKYKCPDCGWEPPDPWQVIIHCPSFWEDEYEDEDDEGNEHANG
jgi:hypothetical protein